MLLLKHNFGQIFNDRNYNQKDNSLKDQVLYDIRYNCAAESIAVVMELSLSEACDLCQHRNSMKLSSNLTSLIIVFDPNSRIEPSHNFVESAICS